MKLKEYEGVSLFSSVGIPAPAGVVISRKDRQIAEKIKHLADPLLVKAQVVSGKRKKAGGVLSATKKTVSRVCKNLFAKKINGFPVNEVYIVEKVPVRQELYLAITIDSTSKQYVLIFSAHGGVDIEELAAASPEKIQRVSFYDVHGLNLRKFFPKSDYQHSLIAITKQLYKLMKLHDATLVEINPLLVTSHNQLVAADAKIVLDENALFRHPEITYEGRYFTSLELLAKKHHINYVELDGNIAVIGNGAGLVMATLDLIHHFGGKPANFCDIGGGTGADVMETALDLALRKKKVKAVLINIFAGITHCDEIAEGIKRYMRTHRVKIPLIIRMIGTHEVQAKNILKKYIIFHSLEESIQHAVEVVRT